MRHALVVGGGVAGCTWAHILGLKGWNVTLIERAPVLGGGCQTLYFGGHPYTLGPRHLFTPHQHVFEWLHERVPLRRLNHYLLTYVEEDGQFYSYPIHADDIPLMPDRERVERELAERPDPRMARNFEEYWIYSVGPTLYKKFVKSYSAKMWQITSNTLLTDFRFDGKGVGLQMGTRQCKPDYWVAYPCSPKGWNDYFDIAAQTPGVRVRLNTTIEAFDVQRPAVRVGGEWITADILVSSISPDDLFERQWGELQYIGRELWKLVLPVEQVIPDPIFFLHYPNDEGFTRVVEYKKLTGHKASSTLLGIEIPSRKNKLYPYPMLEQQELAERYRRACSDRVFNVGRMGNYRYYDIAMIVDEALRLSGDL